MLATLLSLAGYLFYILCMMASPALVGVGLSKAFPSFDNLPKFIRFWNMLIIPMALKNFQWAVLISESHYTLPSNVSQVISLLLCLAGYLACVVILPLLDRTCDLVWGAEQRPGWLVIIAFGITFVVTDKVTSYYMDPAVISEFLSSILRFLSYIASLAVYLSYIACMVALSCLMLAVAYAAILETNTWWPELIHTSIVGLTLQLLNMMWGSPFQKPSAGSDTREALVGLAVYVVYIVSSMVLSSNLPGTSSSLLNTFVISLSFVLLDVFVKPSSVPDKITALEAVAAALIAFFFLVAMSFVVFMLLHTWVVMLLGSSSLHRPAGTFTTTVGLTFVAMKAMFDIMLAVQEPSVFSDMKAGLLGITHMLNEYHGAHLVIRNLTVLAVPLLSIRVQSSCVVFTYTKGALIVALGLLLTMPPGPGMPITEMPSFTLVSDDFVQQTINEFVIKQIQGTDGGETKLLTDS